MQHSRTAAILAALAGVAGLSAIAPTTGTSPAPTEQTTGQTARGQVTTGGQVVPVTGGQRAPALSLMERALGIGQGGGGLGAYTSPNTVSPGRNMPARRAARKLRNVKRHRRACK